MYTVVMMTHYHQFLFLHTTRCPHSSDDVDRSAQCLDVSPHVMLDQKSMGGEEGG